MVLKLSISVEGPGSVAEIAELRHWLHNARIREVEAIEQKVDPPKAGEQGPTLLAVLSVVLAAPAVVELVSCIYRFIEARTPRVTVIIETPERKIKIVCANPPPLPDLVAQANRLARL